MISEESANRAWIGALVRIMNLGDSVSPRGMETKEIRPNIVSFDMNRPICYHQNRKLSYKFMAAEAYWIVSGSMFAEDITPYNKHIGQFSDDGYIFNGNYGVPFAYQLEYVANSLFTDRSTRQAVLTIWRPNPIHSKDYPCTISLGFSVRDGKIDTFVTMRSSDGWLGLPYDVFNFTVMTLRVLCRLNEKIGTKSESITLGNMHLFLMSSHLYKRNFLDVLEVTNESPDKGATSSVPERALHDWNFLSKSLIACRDTDSKSISDETLWEIRPK